jgi:hypothetical protein
MTLNTLISPADEFSRTSLSVGCKGLLLILHL